MGWLDLIFTNKSVGKMKSYGVSEGHAYDAYKNGKTERWSNGKGYNSVRKYNGYEVGVSYFTDKWCKTRVTSTWKRDRR